MQLNSVALLLKNDPAEGRSVADQSTSYTYTSTKQVPSGFMATAAFALRQYGLVGTAARFVLLRDECRKFVKQGRTRSERRLRKELLASFGRVQKSVPCAHSPFQFVLMAKYLLELEPEGAIVQCGCFKGGSTAKLSLLAKHTGRRLYVCDSFCGLPKPDGQEGLLRRHGEGENYALVAGGYAGTLEEVKENVTRYGCIDVCEFVPGWFEETLGGLDVRPACVFTDVDFVSSARDCLRHLWPLLAPGGYWFTHEAMFSNYVHGMLDAGWWHEVLDECPPVMMGAGSGLSELARSLGYMRKPTRRLDHAAADAGLQSA